MEEARLYTSATKQVDDLHTRNMPDIQKDTEFVMEHLNDPNFDLTQLPSYIVEGESTKGDVGDDRSGAINVDDESPYPEVRAAVSNIDDPSMPVNTFRMWFLGISLSLITSGLNQVLEMRYPRIFVSAVIAQLMCFPLGRGLAAILPARRFNTLGYIWSLNPAPGTYSNYVVLTQRVFYGQTIPITFQILLAIGCQCIGFCFAGILRQFVVWPSNMIWPGALSSCAFFNMLHKNYRNSNQGYMTHEHFFWIATAGTFIWYWLPGYLFTGLSMFNWVCWIAPKNIVINTLFGTRTGLGMSILTFDWAIISFLGSPLITPWWYQINTGVGLLLMIWVLAPILYFTNVWNSAHFPISGRTVFDNTGSPYIMQHVITNGVFDPVKYAAYSPVFLPMIFAVVYGAEFAAFPAIFMHMFLWYRKDIFRRIRNTLKDEHDIHSRLMQYYPEVPLWWYGIIGIISLSFLCITIKIIPTRLPIWAAVVAILLSFILSIPLSILMAISNQQIATQVVFELIAGYMLPGKPIANMIFKAVGYMTNFQATKFAADLKLGHYMKVPPRIMFTIQIVPTIITCIWVTLIQDWMLNNIEDVCTPQQKQHFICPGSTIFATASVIFGAVGPQRLFNLGAPYSALLWFFPIGFLVPIPFYFLARRFPFSIWRYINIPAVFGVLAYILQFSAISYSSWIIHGFIFSYVIRRFRFRWWIQYNYILSTALDAGTAISMVVIFFTLTLPKRGGIELNWWGNSVWQKTADTSGMPFKPIPESGFIGPAKWS